jgi:hypothetical protein
MLRRLIPIITLSLLSGCTLLNSEQHHQETLDAINRANEDTANQITNLSLAMSNQMDYIESLEEQVAKLSTSVESFQAETIKEVRRKPDPIVVPAPAPVVISPSNDIVLGEVEKVSLESIDHSFDARIDTGAATSSLNAVDVEEFERNGEDWVRFHLDVPTKEGEDHAWIETPVIRYVKIKQATNDDIHRRAVVQLWVKLGTIHEKAEFTLADRSHMSHPVLIGREFIRDIALVDVSKKYLQSKVTEQKSN